MNAVLITGTSSGYGQQTARHFPAQGWNVVATMRTPRPGLLPESDGFRVVALDVTAPESIAVAVEAAGPVDVLANNAGVPTTGQLRFPAGPDAVRLDQAK
ncbi:SDR family NAD(P)-dependent oxidoreductase [Streptomyces sp. MAI_2237]